VRLAGGRASDLSRSALHGRVGRAAPNPRALGTSGGADRILKPLRVLPLIERGVARGRDRGRPGHSQSSFARASGALTIVLVSVIVLGALWATVQLIGDLIHGGPETNSATDLLEAGTIVWVSNNIAFALLYWELDGGGAATRAHHLPTHADLAFPQQLNLRIAPPGWRPRFIDYLYLGFTNATALSPTDVMPLAPWAKIAMAVQSLVSLGLLGLFIARAVNVFT
jgi:hypothetical protein